jgi:hypothetical protein
MPLFGAHMSVTGGLHNAVAVEYECATVQLFTKSRPFRSCQRTPR